jgi:sigma-B regulation protein RsbU (phosphoserine phosphatase)
MAETRAYVRALMLTRTDVGEILALANRALESDTSDEHFVTLLLASLDPANRSLIYASAGHTPGYVIDDSGSVSRELWSTGMPLGIDADGRFSAAQPIDLRAGDVVLLLTDGITEASDASGEPFGGERAVQSIRANRHLPAAKILEALCDQVRQFQADEQKDDITAVVMKVL